MKKELENLLLEVKSNPSSGISHDAKMTIVKVEEIFVLDELIKEVKILGENLAAYNSAAIEESKAMRYLTIALGAVAILQLFIAYGQFKLGEVQTETSQEQVQLQNAVWKYERMRNDRLEKRDVDWRREDLQFQGRLP